MNILAEHLEKTEQFFFFFFANYELVCIYAHL